MGVIFMHALGGKNIEESIRGGGGGVVVLSSLKSKLYPSSTLFSRSQWPRRLRRESAAARLLGLWVRIPPGI